MTSSRSTLFALAITVLYAAGLAGIWYSLTDRWEYMLAAGVPLNLALGFALGTWWAPLLAGIGTLIAIPDEISYDSGPAWPLALLVLTLPSVPLIAVGYLLRKATHRLVDAARAERHPT